ncbi:transglycosylase domain-containing protein [Azospirillum sp.]|uniref:transglycosylase domain-containing protein n=1 Tax=Azospirillum sp. TaxID=34012 RepID=UPI003D747427
MTSNRSDELFAGLRPVHSHEEDKPLRLPKPKLPKLPKLTLARRAKRPKPERPSGGHQPPPPPRPKVQKPKPAKRGRSWLRTLGTWTVVAGIWGGMAAGAVLAYFAYDLPDIGAVAQAERRPAVIVLASDGTEFARFGDLHGTVLTVKELPPHLVNAVLAIEDRRFYYHFGIDPIGLARAVYVNWRSGRAVQGGSTITQQLAKNLFLTPEKSLKRKMQEAMLALWLEHRFSKDQILTAYLNRVYLGAGTYGVDAAARTYFGKPATQADVREAAVIAGLLKAPSRYAPSSNPDESAERAKVVMAAMVDGGFITAQELEAARNTPPAPKHKPGGDGRYFADWVTELVNGFIGAEHGDVVVRTTLDLKVQRAAENRVQEILTGPGAQQNVGQAAVVAMAPDGAVRALVGGRDYDASEFNRATQARRQPGSSFKPFVYLAALQQGWNPDSTIEDTPLRIGTWAPSNYEGKFRGSVTLATALAHSSNVGTVRLIERVGVDRVRQLAASFGVGSPLGRDLSLALGTSEVTLLELTRAYAGLANRGVPVMPYAITEIADRQGNVLYRRQGGGADPVADPAQVGQLVRMMTGVVEYGTGKSARLDRPVAGKTGTTQDYHDAWFMGFTADLVAGVWLGNDNNAEMKRVTGGSLPAKLWHAFMADAHAGLPPRPLPGMDGVAGPAYVATAPLTAGEPAHGKPTPSGGGGGGIGGLIDRLLGGVSAPSGPVVRADLPSHTR